MVVACRFHCVLLFFSSGDFSTFCVSTACVHLMIMICSLILQHGFKDAEDKHKTITGVVNCLLFVSEQRVPGFLQPLLEGNVVPNLILSYAGV